ncbi:hypothetical protein STIAU_1546 [Stigmatella aurantiaca DW4/3-1]|uniref:Phytase-like domain-containing protein n=1 Tax=Stigmatella aurantiaca (strain DW4/3-1) TaxID=378806 RepID=Q09DD8_STIAD|nr:hypothetical protein STIAU_1546 [Stigmatella aurantiaca DW4/3-1]
MLCGCAVSGRPGAQAFSPQVVAATQGVLPSPRRVLTLEAPDAPGRPAHVSSASGIVRAGHWIHVVADDSLFLATFPAEGDAPGRLVRLFPGTLPEAPKARKALKPDLEALCLLEGVPEAPHGAVLAVPSGSTPERRRGALVPLEADGGLGTRVREVDFAPLYARLARELGTVNVEGAALTGGRLWLFNRGNDGEGQDAVVALDAGWVLRALGAGTPLPAEGVLTVRRWKLGRVGSVPLSFTDAAPLPDGRLVFTAAAEATQNAFLDGEVVGSALGVLSPEGKPLLLKHVTAKVKLEGVAAWPAPGGIHLLLVSDADDPSVAAPLFETLLTDANPG